MTPSNRRPSLTLDALGKKCPVPIIMLADRIREVPIGQTVEVPALDVVISGKKILGSMMGDNRFRVDMPRYVDFYLSGQLKLDEMISARLKLDQVNHAFDEMRKGTAARSVIVFD